MQNIFEAQNGAVNLEGAAQYHDAIFGYTLYEEVIDPENPEGPRAIAMHISAKSMSKAWMLHEPGYGEGIELLEGRASLIIGRSETADWEVVILSPENPKGNDLRLRYGDVFCVVAGEEDVVVLSRPSKDFDISFESAVTRTPTEELSRFIIDHVNFDTLIA